MSVHYQCYSHTYYPASSGVSTYAPTVTTTYTYQVKVVQKSAGTVSSPQTWNLAYEPRSLRVTTSNNTVTIDAFSSTGLAGTTTSNSYTFTSPTKTSGAGIIISAPNYGQTTALDNFSLK
jgi:hypothetical protein